MARQRSFDENRVLDRATACFWRNGYSATSIRDLEREMGIASSSLYNAFGGKQAIFARAVDHYMETGTRKRLARLSETTDPLEALRSFFDRLVEASAASRNGCLIVNSAVEHRQLDAPSEAAVMGGLHEMQARLGDVLGRARDCGQLPADTDTDRLSAMLLGSVVAIRTLARAKAPESDLQAIADGQMTLLHALGAHRASA